MPLLLPLPQLLLRRAAIDSQAAPFSIARWATPPSLSPYPRSALPPSHPSALGGGARASCPTTPRASRFPHSSPLRPTQPPPHPPHTRSSSSRLPCACSPPWPTCSRCPCSKKRRGRVVEEATAKPPGRDGHGRSGGGGPPRRRESRRELRRRRDEGRMGRLTTRRRRRRPHDTARFGSVFRKDNRTMLSRKDLFKDTLSKAAHAWKRIVELRLTEEEANSLRLYVDQPGYVDLPWGMFVPSIKGQGTEEQQQKWLPLAYKFQIIGCYAQTELGHGSNVQGLETTTTFDPKIDEFVIHSPTLTSSKWWPGGLGKASTHAVVYTRLITEGNDYGIHGFIVQLRILV